VSPQIIIEILQFFILLLFFENLSRERFSFQFELRNKICVVVAGVGGQLFCCLLPNTSTHFDQMRFENIFARSSQEWAIKKPAEQLPITIHALSTK